MASLKELEERIRKIEERNKKVEKDKAWETSITRKAMIAVATYIVIFLFLFTAKIPQPLENAIVPTAAFFLSTLTIPHFKKLWLKHIHKKNA